MRLGIIFSAILIGSLFAWTLVQYGWTPPFILWDGRAFVYFGLVCSLLAFFAAIGLATLVPTDRLPAYVKGVPFSVAVFAVGAAVLGVTSLTPQSSAAEALGAIGIGVGVATLGGALLGVITSMWPDKEAEKLSVDEQRRRILLGLPVISIGGLALLIFPRSRDDPRFQMYGRYGSDSSSLEIGLTTGPLDEKRAILSISAGGDPSIVAFDHEDWPAVAGLIARAESDSPSTMWRLVGEANDTGAPISTLQLSSGPGMRFTVRSAHNAPTEHILSRADFDRFNADVARVSHDIIPY